MVDALNERTEDVRIFISPAELFAFTAERIRLLSDTAIADCGRFTAAFSGGHTPIGLYTELARDPATFDWKRTDIFLVDERAVPFEDSRSNFGMIKKTLLGAVPIPRENVHPMPVDRVDLHAAAKMYEDEIRAFFHAPPGIMPRFDLVLLGIGEDGHTASLFPGSPLLQERTRLAAAVPEDEGRTARITLTLPVINSARHVIFLAAGKTKAPIVKLVVEEGDDRLPAKLVRPEEGSLSFHLDREAASLLGAL